MAFDAFFELYDSKGKLIEGESTDKHHPKTMQAISYKWGLRHPTTPEEGGGMSHGKSDFGEFNIVVHMSKATPILFNLAATGEHMQKGILYVRKAGGGTQQDFLIYTFMEMIIASLDWGHDAGSTTSTESITFNYTCGHIEYRQQDEKGNTTKSGNKAGWDCKKNSAFTM